MRKSRFLAIAIMMLTATYAHAGVANIGLELTVPSGANRNSPTCIKKDAPFDDGKGGHGIQCVGFSGKVIALSGTFDLKPLIGDDKSAEALTILWCNVGGQATQVWRGENWTNEPIHMNLTDLAPANIIAPCWLEVQTGGYFQGDPKASAYEAALTIYTNNTTLRPTKKVGKGHGN